MLAKEKIIIGISGVSNAGKSSLSLRLQEAIPNCKVIHQDDFFKPDDEISVDSNGFYQYDVLAALNMDAMMSVVHAWIDDPSPASEGTPRVLLIEGFLLYTYRPLLDVFDVRYFVTVPFDVAKRRRSTRVYVPADPPGYFEGHVWPMFLKHRKEMSNLGVDVGHLDGTSAPDELFRLAWEDIREKVARASRV